MKINFALTTLVLVPPALAIGFSPIFKNVDQALASTGGSSKDADIEKVWEEVQKLGPQAGRVVHAEAIKVHSEAAHVFEQFQDAVQQVIVQAHKIQQDIEKKNVTTVEYLAERLSREIVSVYEDLKDLVNDPLPEERGERARTRARIANRIMDQFRLAYIQVLTDVGVPQEEATAQFSAFSSKLVHVILIIGNIADEHPKFVEALVFAVSMTVLHEMPIFRSILTLLGFDPLGPVKETAATWAQKTFGDTVSGDNWAVILQNVGIIDTLQWLDRVAVSAGLAAIVGHAIENGTDL